MVVDYECNEDTQFTRLDSSYIIENALQCSGILLSFPRDGEKHNFSHKISLKLDGLSFTERKL